MRDAILLARADRAARPRGLPGPVHHVRADPLDEGSHDHPDDDIDPRLEALRGFVAD